MGLPRRRRAGELLAEARAPEVCKDGPHALRMRLALWGEGRQLWGAWGLFDYFRS